MASFKKVQGMDVVTITEGASAGTVQDLLFDLETRAILGYRIKASGVFGKTCGVATTAVRVLGRDVVLVESESAIEVVSTKGSVEDGRAWVTAYVGSKVMSRKGEAVGVVEDVEVERDRVVGLLLDQDRVVPVGPRVTLGKDVVVLEDASQAEKAPSGEGGFWSRMKVF